MRSKKPRNTLRQLVTSFLRIDTVRRRQEKIEQAARRKAEIHSDFIYHDAMRSFYEERVAQIDPHTDWWEFADAKQKHQDNRELADHYLKLSNEAQAKVEALMKA